MKHIICLCIKTVLILCVFSCGNPTDFNTIDSVTCESEGFTETEDLYCDHEDGYQADSRQRSGRNKSRHHSSKSAGGHTMPPRRNQNPSDDSGIPSADGENLTETNCTNQRIKNLRLNKSYHHMEQNMHQFTVNYNIVWLIFYWIRDNRQQSAYQDDSDYASLSQKFNQLRQDFNTIVNAEHTVLNQKYFTFKETGRGFKTLENMIHTHTKTINSTNNKWSYLVVDWQEEQNHQVAISSNIKVVAEKAVVESHHLLEKSYDFAIKVCKKLNQGYRLTPKGEDLVEEYNKLWKKSDRMQEEYNHLVRRRQIHKYAGLNNKKLRNARAINALEDKLLKELVK